MRKQRRRNYFPVIPQLVNTELGIKSWAVWLQSLCRAQFWPLWYHPLARSPFKPPRLVSTCCPLLMGRSVALLLLVKIKTVTVPQSL